VDDTSRWREVDRLFEGALDLPEQDRSPFLDRGCGADRSLRAEVERLLVADVGQGGEFLERPLIELLELDGEREGETRLGPYRLLEALQSGGMGTVYAATRDDDQYNRRVAIKVLRAGLADGEAAHRFRFERQILARLEHPHIARLYDGGETSDGRPYLVMELIEGQQLDVYCDRNRLTLEARLGLFRKVCGAVQHAHQSLLVHRDLKPSNILVGADGEPKLLDFGIAKQLEPSASARADDLTRTGVRVMTPSYASPEQVRGEAITTASDVYSLGVLLYELVSGTGPYPIAGLPLHEIEDAICERPPERPSRAFDPGAPNGEEIAHARGLAPRALRRRLQGDLDNIVLMALRKEPHRRYPSAASLAEDVQRHLRDLPVAARPDTVTYRLRKLARRRRETLAAAALLLLLATGFGAHLRTQSRRQEAERDKAESALSFLVETFTAANPYENGGEHPTAQDLLDRGAARAATELANQPRVQAALLDAFGRVNAGLARPALARAQLERALELRRKSYGPGSTEVAETLEHLARVRRVKP
jgi:serine/threonine-protein kinase